VLSRVQRRNWGCLYARYNSNIVKIVEVSPRDGLQNERMCLSVKQRTQFIDLLSNSGLSVIEVGSFVSPKWIPHMSGSGDVFASIHKKPNTRYPLLVPNMKGLEEALARNVSDIAIFSSASEGFSLKNINCSVDESLSRFKEVVSVALKHGMWVRGYISNMTSCPYDGPVNQEAVLKVASHFLDFGCQEISLGDTTGVATAGQIQKLLRFLIKHVPVSKMAIHCHDTYGQALANIWVAINEGIRIVDSSVAGLGGCPFAKGASGNVATEDVLYMLEGSGFTAGVDLQKLDLASNFILNILGIPSRSKVGTVRNTLATTHP